MKRLTLLALAAPLVASAGDWNEQTYRQEVVVTTLNQLNSEIQEKGDPQLRRLTQQVKVVLLESGVDEPRSSITGAGRTTEMPDLFVAKTANLARLMRLARDGGDQACAYKYKAHMEQTGSRLSPESYLESGPLECAPLRARLPLGPMGEALAEREVRATLAYAYLHELGHQVHNHQGGGIRFPSNLDTKENQCAFLSVMKLRRELEYEADDYAVDSLAQLGKSQLVFYVGTLWLLPPATADARQITLDQLFAERLAAHPNPGLRWAHILDRTAIALSKKASLNPQVAQLIDELKDWQRRAQQAVAENDKALSPC